jgi:hypothetical protein
MGFHLPALKPPILKACEHRRAVHVRPTLVSHVGERLDSGKTPRASTTIHPDDDLRSRGSLTRPMLIPKKDSEVGRLQRTTSITGRLGNDAQRTTTVA